MLIVVTLSVVTPSVVAPEIKEARCGIKASGLEASIYKGRKLYLIAPPGVLFQFTSDLNFVKSKPVFCVHWSTSSILAASFLSILRLGWLWLRSWEGCAPLLNAC